MKFQPHKTSKNLKLLEFDYQASTPCALEVCTAMEPYWSDFWGNPSSRENRSGLRAAAAVDLARERIASYLGVEPQRFVFTSGATESNNLALLGVARAQANICGKPGHIITSNIEHHAVLDPLRQLVNEGFRLTELVPDSDGLLKIDQFIEAIEPDTILVSVMLANNEIGVIQPLQEIAKLCKDRGIKIHTDAAQAFGYIPFDINTFGVDLISISGHKIYGPKGIGGLAIRSDIPLVPLQWGGGQQEALRPGTIPVPLTIGFAKAAEIAIRDLSTNQVNYKFLRDSLWEGLKDNIPDLIINGTLKNRLPHNLNITIKGVKGSKLYSRLKSRVLCSSGSACAQGKPSHVLRAIGRTKFEAESSIRFSLGRSTSLEDVRNLISVLESIVRDLRKSS